MTTGVALAVFYICAQLRGWWLFLAIPVNLFALWWFPHISQYAIKHPENVPYRINRMLAWSVRRLDALSKR